MYLPDHLISITDIFVDLKNGMMLTVCIYAMGFTHD